jgi:hypothetical protein
MSTRTMFCPLGFAGYEDGDLMISDGGGGSRLVRQATFDARTGGTCSGVECLIKNCPILVHDHSTVQLPNLVALTRM